MELSEFNALKGKINDAELNSAAAKGKMEAIQEQWKTKYGFETVEDAEKKLAEINAENEEKNKKREKLFEKLQEICKF